MPKIQYIHKKFHGKTLPVINQANKIIIEYAEEGMNLTLRQLYYQFVARHLIEENTPKAYKRFGKIITNGRLSGHIDWYAIEDLTRNLKGNSHWKDPGEIISSASRGFKMDHWKDQKWRPEVWVEKEALIGVIAPICKELDIDYFACKGYVSQSEMWRASQRFIHRARNDQKTILIHLGDHDPSGMDMTRDIESRTTLFKAYFCVINRIALNMDQIEKYNPPPDPAKLTDARATEYIRNFGQNSWELDALEPRVLRDLIKEEVLKYRDDKLYKKVRRTETKYRKILANVEKNWRTL